MLLAGNVSWHPRATIRFRGLGEGEGKKLNAMQKSRIIRVVVMARPGFNWHDVTGARYERERVNTRCQLVLDLSACVPSALCRLEHAEPNSVS